MNEKRNNNNNSEKKRKLKEHSSPPKKKTKLNDDVYNFCVSNFSQYEKFDSFIEILEEELLLSKVS